MLFREEKSVWWSKLLWAIAIGDVILGVYLWKTFSKDSFAAPGAWIGIGVLALTLITMVIGAVMFARYSVTFDGERLAFGFSKVNGYVPVDQIESVIIVPHVNLLRFGGLGWRFDFGGRKIGFIANKGSAMEIVPKNGKWNYVFNCNDVETLGAELTKMGVEVKDEES